MARKAKSAYRVVEVGKRRATSTDHLIRERASRARRIGARKTTDGHDAEASLSEDEPHGSDAGTKSASRAHARTHAARLARANEVQDAAEAEEARESVRGSERVRMVPNVAEGVASHMAQDDDTDVLATAKSAAYGARAVRRREGGASKKGATYTAEHPDKVSTRSGRERARKTDGALSRRRRALARQARERGIEAASAMSRRLAQAANVRRRVQAIRAAVASGALAPALAGVVSVACASAVVVACIVSVLSFSWWWEDANKIRVATSALPEACAALRPDVEAVCTEVFGDDRWADLVLAIMAAESGGSLDVETAAGASYVRCPGGCGTPLSSVRQDVMQAAECAYGPIVVHGANAGAAVTCAPSLGTWQYGDAPASTALASIYAGVLYLRDGLSMWSGYLGEIGPDDIDAIALVVQGYNYNMSRWFSWCKSHGVTAYTLEASQQFQATLPAGYKGTADHATRVLAFYPRAVTIGDGNDSQRALASAASTRATNDPEYSGFCLRWALNVYADALGRAPIRHASAYEDFCANRVSEDMDAIPVGAAVYGSGWPHGDAGENPDGHVGIYLGDGRVADYMGLWSLDTWLSKQTGVCNGRTGFLGWGWLSNDDLTESD